MKKGLQIESITKWLGIEKPLIISGPCSAETEAQMVSTAKQIAATGKVHALRAGIWKPRTRPGQYEAAAFTVFRVNANCPTMSFYNCTGNRQT